jgi:23S rRNA (uracil1939-C5)-methyltransferase
MMRKTQVTIESVAFKGYGVARIDGKVVFVPYAVTGDEAWIEIVEEKKKYSMGRLVQIFKPSPWRVNPPCPYIGICGGCQWQHIKDSVQGELKKEILKDLLRRLGRLKEVPPISIFPSPQSFGYRIRTQLKVKGKILGYYQEKSHRIVDIHKCLIAHPLINQMLPLVRKKLSSSPQIGEIEINISPDEDKGILILHGLSLDRILENGLREFFQQNAIFKGIAIARKEGLTSWGDPDQNFTVPWTQGGEKRNLKFRVSPGSFSQVNLEQNQTLIQTVLQFSEINKEDEVFDFYAGVGNLTLPLALRAKEVLGIEENRMAIDDARFNVEKNGIRNCEFIQGKVEDVFMSWNRGSPDLIVLDPPRTGAKTILDQLVRLKPKKIIYISCEPTTFSRDLHLFSEQGYLLQKLALIDMFPQTYHMEVVGLLQQSYDSG